MPVAMHVQHHKTQSTLKRGNFDDEITAAQIDALYRHMPMVLAVNVVNSALVAAVLASYMHRPRWWIFFGLVVMLTAVRAVGWEWYRQRRTRVDTQTIWMIFATVGSGLSGMLWGAAGTLFLSVI
jgi:predicted signal transduction protein with EAL and GGDEF domain